MRAAAQGGEGDIPPVVDDGEGGLLRIIAELSKLVAQALIEERIRAGEIVYDGPTSDVTQEVLDSIYNGAAVPQAGE